MDSLDDDFSYYLEMYKDNYIAHGLNPNADNEKLLNDAKDGLNRTHKQLEGINNELIDKNNKIRGNMTSVNKRIKKSEKENKKLENTFQRLDNTDAGAIEQNLNFNTIYNERKLKLILELVLIALILILGYINGDILQAIRSKFSAKIK